MNYVVVWDNTPRTSRTLDAVSGHPAEDIVRYWRTIAAPLADSGQQVTARSTFDSPQPCRNCGQPVTVARLNSGERTCYRCDRQRTAARNDITAPIPCRTCKFGMVVVSRAKLGERRCRKCLGRAKPRRPGPRLSLGATQ